MHSSLWLCLVIAARPSSIPYLSALLPSELELQALEETDSSEQDDQTDSENTAGNMINVSLHYWKLLLFHCHIGGMVIGLHWSVNRFWGCCCSRWGYFKIYTPRVTQYRNRWQLSHVRQEPIEPNRIQLIRLYMCRICGLMTSRVESNIHVCCSPAPCWSC